MPTVHLIRMVNELKDLFDDPGFKAEAGGIVTSDLKEYFGKNPIKVEPIRKRLIRPANE